METSKDISVRVNDNASQFRDLMAFGLKNIVSACRIFVSEIDAGNRDAFIAALPEFPAAAWSRFEAIGRGTMHERLFYMPPGRAVNHIAALPCSEQKRIIENGVEYLTADNDTLIVKIENITPDIAAQVFLPDGGIRSLGAQRAWLESRKNRQAAPAAVDAPRVEIRGGKLVVNGPVTLGKKELLAYLQQMC